MPANLVPTPDPTRKREANWPPARLPVLAVLCVSLVWPCIIYGAVQAWTHSKNRIEDWLPASFPETKSLVAFFDRFGSDEFLMISWPDCVMEDARALRLEKLLLQPAADGETYFAKADSGGRILASLLARQQLSETQARQRLSGLFLGPDGKQTCVVALVSSSGLADRQAAVRRAWEAAQEATALPVSDIHIAGTTADSVAIDQASSAYLMELNAFSAVICFTILVLSLKSLWLVGIVFLTALFNQQLALAFIYFSGGHVDSVQLLVANLSFVLTISVGLHYLGYFRDAVRRQHPSPALGAIRQALIPSILAAATTSLGFLSLCTSSIVPIRAFGFYAAILVPINAVIALTLLAIHVTWASRWTWQLRRRVTPSPLTSNALPSASAANQQRKAWSWLLSILNRRPLAFVLTWLLVTICLGAGVTRLSTSAGTHKLLSEKSKLIQDYAWLEDHIGALVPLELVVRFPSMEAMDGITSFQRLEAIERLKNSFEALPEVHSTLSVMTFMPTLPSAGGFSNTARRAVLGKLACDAREVFHEIRLLFEDDQEQCWRISGRVAGGASTNFEQLLQQVQTVIDEFKSVPACEAIEVDISGGVPFIYRTQRQLLADLLGSFSTAFVMIAASMALLFRSFMGGLLTMLPNVSPAAVVFGIMGWLGIEVEVGTVLTASVMLGVCVDDTLHLVSHFRALRSHGLSPAAAIQEALENCGGAMLQTSLVCGLGMLVFAFSPFTPVARFAWLTFTLLMVGVLSDLLLTPAILLSPLHPFFYRRKNSATSIHLPSAMLGKEVNS